MESLKAFKKNEKDVFALEISLWLIGGVWVGGRNTGNQLGKYFDIPGSVGSLSRVW
jgi:hypothetical protein